LPGWSLHILCYILLHANTWCRENRKSALFHLETRDTWVGAGKKAELRINRNRTKKDDKSTENVNNIFKEQAGVGKLPKAELIAI